MNHILIREVTEVDLPVIDRLIMELIESVDNREGIDKRMIFKKCQNHPTLGKNHYRMRLPA